VIIKVYMKIMYRSGLFLNYANIARSIQTHLNKQTGEETRYCFLNKCDVTDAD